MQLDLTRYRQPVTELSRTFPPGEVAQEGDAYRIVAPVGVNLEIHKDTNRFRLVGAVRTELELACSRCLEPFRMPIDSSFDVRFLPVSEMSTDEEGQLQDEDVETSCYADDQIDLSELLREQFYLVLPMKPLCVEDCRGLCSACGTNLNAGACGCAPAWEDPRLAPLKALVDPKES